MGRVYEQIRQNTLLLDSYELNYLIKLLSTNLSPFERYILTNNELVDKLRYLVICKLN